MLRVAPGVLSEDRRELDVDAGDPMAPFLVSCNASRHVRRQPFDVHPRTTEAVGQTGGQAIADGRTEHGNRIRAAIRPKRCRLVKAQRRRPWNIGKLRKELEAAIQADRHVVSTILSQDCLLKSR
jgi:hypothetical protein